MKTKVIYRKWKSNGDVLALFPQIPSDNSGHHCLSYAHIGQHGGASPDLTVHTLPANPSEYASLHQELLSIGYNLTIGNRVTSFDNVLRMRETRKPVAV